MLNMKQKKKDRVKKKRTICTAPTRTLHGIREMGKEKDIDIGTDAFVTIDPAATGHCCAKLKPPCGALISEWNYTSSELTGGKTTRSTRTA